jgi:hypothetical protein
MNIYCAHLWKTCASEFSVKGMKRCLRCDTFWDYIRDPEPKNVVIATTEER